MAHRQIEIAIWTAGDDARVKDIGASLHSAGFGVSDRESASKSPDILLVLPGSELDDLQVLCNEAANACPGSARKLIPCNTGCSGV